MSESSSKPAENGVSSGSKRTDATRVTPSPQPVAESRRQPVPLRRRPLDIVILAFCILNLGFITYIVDFEQIAIPAPVRLSPPNFTYPFWPPPALVDLVHWWGANFDPVLLARPAWWKATIWLDVLLFGPFYAVAIYAFVRGRDWIRLPAIIYSAVLWTNVIIILSEEVWGIHASPQLPLVLLANAPWLLFPLIIIARMWKSEHPFTRPPEPR